MHWSPIRPKPRMLEMQSMKFFHSLKLLNFIKVILFVSIYTVTFKVTINNFGPSQTFELNPHYTTRYIIQLEFEAPCISVSRETFCEP